MPSLEMSFFTMLFSNWSIFYWTSEFVSVISNSGLFRFSFQNQFYIFFMPFSYITCFRLLKFRNLMFYLHKFTFFLSIGYAFNDYLIDHFFVNYWDLFYIKWIGIFSHVLLLSSSCSLFFSIFGNSLSNAVHGLRVGFRALKKHHITSG